MPPSAMSSVAPVLSDFGSLDASVIVIADTPTKDEMQHGERGLGTSAGRMRLWWEAAGIPASTVYLTSVLDFLPPNVDYVPKAVWEQAFSALWERLDRLDDPRVFVPTGNYALYALTGKGRVHWDKRDGRHPRADILDWRGSILEAIGWSREEPVKVIPTLPASSVLPVPRWEFRVRKDWERIAHERLSVGNIPSTMRVHRIARNLEDLAIYVNDTIRDGRPIAVDIETPCGQINEYATADGWVRSRDHVPDEQLIRFKSGKRKGQPKTRKAKGDAFLGCIGFADNAGVSMTVPLTKAHWGYDQELATVRWWVQQLLSSRNPKVMQNGMFDTLWLRRCGYAVTNWRYDTRAMHHALDPREDHDLAFMASVYTRQPFWKHEAKDPDSVTKYASNSEALWTYNGIDCCVTWELFEALRTELNQEGLLEFYHRHYADMLEPLVALSVQGILVDDTTRRRRELELRNTLREQTAIIDREAGMSFTVNTGMSTDRLKYYLYGSRGFEGIKAQKTFEKLRLQFGTVEPLNLVPQKKRDPKTKGFRVTTDEVALRRLLLKFPKKCTAVIPALLELRRIQKMLEFLDAKTMSPNGRIHCQYSLCTDAARLASQGVPWGDEGRNLQNIDRELRDVFVPDELEAM